MKVLGVVVADASTSWTDVDVAGAACRIESDSVVSGVHRLSPSPTDRGGIRGSDFRDSSDCRFCFGSSPGFC